MINLAILDNLFALSAFLQVSVEGRELKDCYTLWLIVVACFACFVEGPTCWA